MEVEGWAAVAEEAVGGESAFGAAAGAEGDPCALFT